MWTDFQWGIWEIEEDIIGKGRGLPIDIDKLYSGRVHTNVRAWDKDSRVRERFGFGEDFKAWHIQVFSILCVIGVWAINWVKSDNRREGLFEEKERFRSDE